MNFTIAVITSIIAGATAAMGLGGGSVLLLYLTVFIEMNQLEAQGINLIFFLPIAIIAVIVYCHRGVIKLKQLTPFIIAGIPSAVFFGYLVKFTAAGVLRKIFGILVFLFGIYQIFAKNKGAKNTIEEKNQVP